MLGCQYTRFPSFFGAGNVRSLTQFSMVRTETPSKSPISSLVNGLKWLTVVTLELSKLRSRVYESIFICHVEAGGNTAPNWLPVQISYCPSLGEEV